MDSEAPARARSMLRLMLLGLFLACLTGGVATAAPLSADYVVVKKSARKIMLFNDGRLVADFPIALGDNPIGHKEQRGDERTPEGRYRLTWKNPESKFYRSIHITYPNKVDREKAHALGVSPGGDIKIHGLPNKQAYPSDLYMEMNWTDGCIAVLNEDMDKIWSMVRFNTPIEILP